MEFVRYSVQDGIATIRLDRPAALNALNADVNRDLLQALDMLQADESVRVLILTGSAAAFAAGADVKEMAEATPRLSRRLASTAIEINNRLESLPIPTIAAVAGYCFGGGMEMTLSCDFRIGGPGTTMALPETSLGIIPGANGCARMTMLLGATKAKELVMLSDPAHPLKGKEAYDLGLLSFYAEGDPRLYEEADAAVRAFKDAKKSGDADAAAAAKAAMKQATASASEAEYAAILQKAEEVAKRLAARPACALSAAKAAINRAALETINAGKAAEWAEFPILFDTHDQKEGMAAMLEKRAPNYTNN